MEGKRAMKVFISWSGEPSHLVALALRDWLPSVIQRITPYVSSEDVDKGAPWFSEITEELDSSAFGIICVTRANADSRWLNFEAGALFKSVESIQRRVTPFLVDLKPTELVGPLRDLQVTRAERDDVIRLVKSLNALTEAPMREALLERAVEKWWPDLDRDLNAAREVAESQLQPGPPRDPNDMIEEILEISRGIQRQLSRNAARRPRIGFDPGVTVRTRDQEGEANLGQAMIFKIQELLGDETGIQSIKVLENGLSLRVDGPVSERAEAALRDYAEERNLAIDIITP
jgi:hypothetical protein